jgi:TonB-dependent receptor
MKKQIITVLAAALLGGLSLNAQLASVTGTVSDAVSGLQLEGVRVSLLGTGIEDTTSRSGAYSLDGIEPGSYEVRFDYVGANPLVRSVQLSSGEVEILNIGIDGEVVELDEFVITATDLGTARAINAQRAADSLTTIVASDAIGQFPDQNVAESLQRLPGLSIEKDQGEGRFVSIRGIDPDLSNVSIDGAVLAAPEGESRAVALDVIPNEVVEFLEVTKVITPDMDADAIGGTINIRTKSAFDRNRRFASFKAEAYYNDLLDRTSGKVGVTYSDILGEEGNIGLVISASHEERQTGSDNAEVDGPWEEESAEDGTSGFIAADEIEFRNYEVTRERQAVSATLEFRPSETAVYGIRAAYNYFSDQEERYRWEIKPGEADSVATIGNRTATFNDSVETDRDIKDRFEEQEITVLSFNGTNYVDDWTFDYQLAWTHGEENEPDRLDTDFRTSDEAPFSFSYAFDREGGYVPTITHLSGLNIYEPSNYEFNEMVNEFNISEEDEYSAQINARYEMDFGSHPGYIKFGAKYRSKEKSQDVNVNIYELADGFDLTLANFANIDSRFPFGNNPGGGYLRADPTGIREYFRSTPEAFELDGDGSLEDSSLADYASEEDVLAAYLMAGVDIGDWHIIAGARVEQTDFKTEGFETTFNEDGDILTPTRISAENDYTNFLPGIIARYELNEQTIIRLSWTNSIARPKFSNSAIRREVNLEDNEITVGNPNLDPYEAMNFDATIEYYFESLGFISASIFYKDIDSFIFEQTIEDGFIDENGEAFEVTTFNNGDSADITGFEFAWSQDLTFLPEGLEGFSVLANLTLTSSNANVGRSEDVDFLKQSDTIYTLGLGYENYGFEFRITGTFRSEYLDSLGGDPLEDEFIDDNFQWDISASYDINENINLYFDLINFNNEPKNTYYGVTNAPRQFEEYSWAAKLGVKVRY